MNREYAPRHSRGDVENEHRSRVRFYTGLATAALSTIGVIGANHDDLQQSYAVANYNLEARETHTESNDSMSVIASELSGESVRVNCDDDRLNQRDATLPPLEDGRIIITQGLVQDSDISKLVTSPVITLRESICEATLAFDPTLPVPTESTSAYAKYLYDAWQYSKSIGILLHELGHVAGDHNEARVNCHAYQKLPLALEQLGLPTEAAESGALVAMLTAERVDLPEYFSDECRPGGEYDLGVSEYYLDYDSDQ